MYGCSGHGSYVLDYETFRKKLIYIESFAKISSPTQSGKLLYKFADRFYVQWESMKNFYPDALYCGYIY
ncbi:hypothetical protein [Bifidobacterium merycicum]|uniref:hypothetical protein n=1 Tax=Bifidobacterium merycicum TaxID=78345 RepID=UPI0023F15F4D|nr:hypothetical protein [Bifidobacterium merycicum]